ncbi:SURF1 family protein [Sphingomonas ginsenosidivorax]|uniref:SURF1-like protein n=1 Tax=Sphingomonas ginsenosidivorax TaxID=862135 RepID=A0A5C6UN96_9SPHN|nr:SURF1 family protein [Sphingomonas ginsenosidivorax]
MIFAGFVALGVWQVHRRTWKLALIEQVDARAHALPVAPPRPGAQVTAERDAYRRVIVRGVFLNDSETLVRAATVLGSGYWVMTPLRTSGGVVLVNRGYVSPEQRTAHARPQGEQTVTGYLRITEPGGGFLRKNDPAHGAWYSRDVAAIARARGVSAAPYFIDADRVGEGAPVGGLTVIAFPNNHLVYMLTWFALAGLTLVGFGVFVRQDRRKVAA